MNNTYIFSCLGTGGYDREKISTSNFTSAYWYQHSLNALIYKNREKNNEKDISDHKTKKMNNIKSEDEK